MKYIPEVEEIPVVKFFTEALIINIYAEMEIASTNQCSGKGSELR